MNELVKGLVYYKIFDKSYTHSSHIYSTKNQFDDLLKQEIVHNRIAVTNHFSADNVFILKQTHSNKIINADTKDNDSEGDGVVTTKKNLVLGIQTADCVPVLLSSADGKIIGAAHCGWRGSKNGIIANIVHAMQNLGATRLKALIGPAIAQYSYEVDHGYYQGFLEEHPDSARFFVHSKKPKYYMFDLPGFVRSKLQQLGISDILTIEEDTYTMPAKYPSFRRASHLCEKYYQNILSTIVKIDHEYQRYRGNN